MDKKVIIPDYLQESINPLRRSYPKKVNVMVFDVETKAGLPYFLTFYFGKKPVYFRVTPDTILDVFMEFVHNYYVKNCCNLLFAHNLQFDLFAVLCKKKKK